MVDTQAASSIGIAVSFAAKTCGHEACRLIKRLIMEQQIPAREAHRHDCRSVNWLLIEPPRPIRAVGLMRTTHQDSGYLQRPEELRA